MNSQRTHHRRLALSYLVIIMTMSLIFSAIIYGVTSAQLGRPLPPPSNRMNNGYTPGYPNTPDDVFQSRVDERDAQTRQSLIISLVVLNAVVLAGGAWFSFYLARRTLRPIDEIIRSQTQFISDASHELRTPLTALQATNEVALRKPHIDDAKARQVLEKNIVEVGKLRTLTETLLTLTQVDHKAIKKEQLWLDALADGTVSMMTDAAAAKEIVLTSDVEHVPVMADPVALGQVLAILVDNAIKYSRGHSTVAIKSRAVKDAVLLEVYDHGFGIAPRDQPHIFDRFYRADAARTRTKTSGHGLGLAIAQALCIQQGFTLSLRSSSPDKGSVFVVAMPPRSAGWD